MISELKKTVMTMIDLDYDVNCILKAVIDKA